jgi:hypothetical protein
MFHHHHHSQQQQQQRPLVFLCLLSDWEISLFPLPLSFSLFPSRAYNRGCRTAIKFLKKPLLFDPVPVSLFVFLLGKTP